MNGNHRNDNSTFEAKKQKQKQREIPQQHVEKAGINRKNVHIQKLKDIYTIYIYEYKYILYIYLSLNAKTYYDGTA